MAGPERFLISLYNAAIQASHPRTLFKAIFPHSDFRRGEPCAPRGSLAARGPLLLGAGKAALAMAAAFAEIRGISQAVGEVIVPHGTPGISPVPGVKILKGTHPLPSMDSVRSTRILLEAIQKAPAGAEVYFFLSGGASSLLELPLPGVSLSDLRLISRLLLEAGSNIREMNLVRKRLSQVKGGGISSALRYRSCVTYLLSDVEKDRLDIIGGGPTYPDRSTNGNALEILKKYRLIPRVWRLARLLRGKETKPPVSRFPRHSWVVIGNNADAVRGARAEALRLGVPVIAHQGFLSGEAREIGVRLAGLARTLPRPVLFAAGGEPTVRVRGRGKGGRCQEAALAFALCADPAKKAYLLAAGTDGKDGPTDAAGAIATHETAAKARAANLNPSKFLEKNDSYRFFDRLNNLIRARYTGTNVNDLFLLYLP